MLRTRVLLSVTIALLLVLPAASIELVPEENFGVGIPDTLVARYVDFRAQQLNSGNASVVRIPLGFVKGLSRSFTASNGEMTINLASGNFAVSLKRLTAGATYGLWLVDRPADDLLELPDVAVRLAVIRPLLGTTATASGSLLLGLPLGFALDRVVLATGSASPADVVAAGSMNAFQKIFFRRQSLVNEAAGKVSFAETLTAPLFSSLVPDLAAAIDALPIPILAMGGGADALFVSPLAPDTSAAEASGGSGSVKVDQLISKGARLFFEETFKGNGRTCGTCHPASNNFTIDVPFIASLPDNDPLFVAEFNPALANLERPKLMRGFGLILENVDGLEDPINKFVMRGVPHTLGLQVSLLQDTSLPNPPAEMTGWSGDGAPGTGSLREFAIGAVTQHFTKSLNRVPRQDFKLPNETQLDAMEAFQLSLGRNTDFDLAGITFNDTNVDNGRLLFINGTGDPAAQGRCVACHGNAGALAANGQNRNFNTNVEDVMNPARDVENFPIDGGFGRTPVDPNNGAIGNLTFNTAPVVEAADTAPFFHNNVVATLEGVVEFYSGPEFNNPTRPAAARFSFDELETADLADFMRALNAVDNINIARRELEEILALQGNRNKETQTRLATAFFETEDAIAVLTEGGIFPTAVSQLNVAKQRIAQAQQTTNADQREALIRQAITQLNAARATIGTFAP